MCIVDDGKDTGWEHVSVSCRDDNLGFPVSKMPTWNQMCQIKDLFWDTDECVIQFHPPKSEYVNQHQNCLHLWKKVGVNMETPPKILV